MKRSVIPAALATLMLVFGATAMPASAQPGGDVLVSVGSPSGPFSANKQNEPAVAVDQAHPNVLAAGSNDNIDMESCNAGSDTDLPLHRGRRRLRHLLLIRLGRKLDPADVHGPERPRVHGCRRRSRSGLRAAGRTHRHIAELLRERPGVRRRPGRGVRAGARTGGFSYANGSRLYYANLASALPGHAPFKGFEAIAVSHTDDVAAAAAGDGSAWSDPVIASKQNSALFSDKEQVWADNAASSSFFGNVYVCYAGFRGSGPVVRSPCSSSRPGMVATAGSRSRSRRRQITPISKNGFGRSGCTIRTDSTASYTCSTTSSHSTPRGPPPARSR